MNLKMLALTLIKRGSENILDFQLVNTPVPKSNEVLIKVGYCGLNHLDFLIKEGKRLGPTVFPHILGSEIVGRTIPGNEQVAVYPWIFCGKCDQCKNGNENICDFGGTIGRTRQGGYAEYVVVPKVNVYKIPPNLRPDWVCALILAGTTARHLVDRAKVKKGGICLVTGATGGVGTVVVQLLKQKRCTVICITSSESKVSLLKKLGVDSVIPTKNFPQKVKKLYPLGVDYVIDIVGGGVWSEAIKTLAKNGTMVFCATTLMDEGVVNIGSVFARQLNILGSYAGRMSDMKAILNLVKKGSIKPVIDSVVPFKEGKKGFKKLTSKKAFGKIILSLN